MISQDLVNLGIATGFTVIGWFARQIWAAVNELRRDLQTLQIQLPTSYVRRDEFSEALKEIKDISKQIFEKISSLEQRKADK